MTIPDFSKIKFSTGLNVSLVILSLFCPSLLQLLIFEPELFMELETIKLFGIAFAIGFPIHVFSLILVIIYFPRHEGDDTELILYTALVASSIWLVTFALIVIMWLCNVPHHDLLRFQIGFLFGAAWYAMRISKKLKPSIAAQENPLEK